MGGVSGRGRGKDTWNNYGDVRNKTSIKTYFKKCAVFMSLTVKLNFIINIIYIVLKGLQNTLEGRKKETKEGRKHLLCVKHYANC